MKLVLAEKPSVAQSIAKVLGVTKRQDGYLEGNGYRKRKRQGCESCRFLFILRCSIPIYSMLYVSNGHQPTGHDAESDDYHNLYTFSISYILQYVKYLG